MSAEVRERSEGAAKLKIDGDAEKKREHCRLGHFKEQNRGAAADGSRQPHNRVHMHSSNTACAQVCVCVCVVCRVCLCLCLRVCVCVCVWFERFA